jgi:hypothetical protein
MLHYWLEYNGEIYDHHYTLNGWYYSDASYLSKKYYKAECLSTVKGKDNYEDRWSERYKKHYRVRELLYKGQELN